MLTFIDLRQNVIEQTSRQSYKNLINERSDENKETNYDENNIENEPEDNNEYKDTTSINFNVNSLDKGQERMISYSKQDIRGFETSKNG